MITTLNQFKINEMSNDDFKWKYSGELREMIKQLRSIHNCIEPFLIEDENNISTEQQQLFDGIDNILSKYDKYLERIIFDTQTTKLSELVDSALQNEERIGTEPQFMIYAIEEVYNFLKTKNIINENIDDELYIDNDNYPYDLVLTDGRYLWLMEQDFVDMAGETNYYTTYFVGNTDDIRSSSQVKFKDIENLLTPEDRANIDLYNKEQGDSNYANSKSFVESKTNENINKINENIDSKYLSIIIKNIKSELDAIQHFYDTNKIDLVKEYLQDQIKTINDIIKKL